MKTIATVTASLLVITGIIWMALSHQKNPTMRMREDVYRNEGAEYLGVAQESLEEGWRLIKPYLPNAETVKAYEERMDRLQGLNLDARGAEIEAILERFIFEIDFYADRTTGSTTRTSEWHRLKNAAPADLFYDMEFNLLPIRNALSRVNPENPETLRDLKEWSHIKAGIERQRMFLKMAHNRP